MVNTTMQLQTAAAETLSTVNLPLNDVFPALSNKTLFWRPKFLAQDQGVAHLPFLFWLTESIRPSLTVQLGFGNGTSYYALCQATEKLDIDGRCYAVDPNLNPKQQYNSLQYEEFSKLLALPYEQANALFAAKSIDLLHINLAADAASTSKIITDWLPLLSAKGVMLLQNSQETSAHSWSLFCQQLKKQYQSFELLQDNGLLAIAAAEIPSDSFARILSFVSHSKAFELVQNVFGRLGKACSETLRADLASEQIALTQKQLHEKELAITASQEKIAQLLDNLQQHKSVLDERQQQVTNLQTALSNTENDAVQQRLQAEQRISLLETIRTSLKQEVETLFNHLEALQAEHSNYKALLDDEQKNADNQKALHAQITQQLAQLQEQLKLQQAQTAAAEQQLQQVKQQLSDTTYQLNQKTAHTRTIESQLSELKAQLITFETNRSSLATAEQKISQLQQILAEENQAKEVLQAEALSLSNDKQQLELQLKAKELSLETLQQAEQAQQARVKQLTLALEQQKASHFNETAVLTQLLQQTQQSERQVIAELQQHKSQEVQQCEQLKRQLSTAHNQLAEMQQQNRLLQAELSKTNAERNKLCWLNSQQQAELTKFKGLAKYSLAKPIRGILGKSQTKTQLAKQREQILASGLFDETYYTTTYPDVAKSGADPIIHFLKFGAYEGRNPSPGFNSAFYLNSYADVRNKGMNPLLHYINFGQAEKRQVLP